MVIVMSLHSSPTVGKSHKSCQGAIECQSWQLQITVNRKCERVLMEKNIHVLLQIFFPTKAVGFCPMMSVNLATGARQ